MKPDSHAPLYGRLVQMPADREPDSGRQPPTGQQWSWVMPWVLALAAVGLTLLLSACASTQPSRSETGQGLLPQIRQSLAEPSSGTPPAVPPEVSRELLPPADLSLAKLAQRPAEARFDLNVVNLPVAEVFEALARDTRYSILVEADLKAAVTVSLKDVTLVDALETLREIYGFEYRVQGNRIFVQKAAFQTRVFQINYPVTTRTRRSSSACQAPGSVKRKRFVVAQSSDPPPSMRYDASVNGAPAKPMSGISGRSAARVVRIAS
jgi:hypothetical protein